jgi:hypothetical protein
MGIKLTPQAVQEIVRECLPNDGELTEEQVLVLQSGKDVSGYKVVRGIMKSFVFNETRLAEQAPQIGALLAQLPEVFDANGEGGGYSFLGACNDRNGDLWTGDHSIMEDLFCLGLATGKAALLLPREMWRALPGGMPYYSVNP